MSRKPPTRATVERWIGDYPELEFNGIDVRCNACNCVLSWSGKTRITKHVASEKHKIHVTGDRSTRETQKEFNIDLLRTMVSCNISFTMLDNQMFRQFLKNCIDGSYNNVGVPAESTLRTGYLSTACQEIQTEVISELHDKNIWLTVDETSDSTGRNIAHVLVGEMQETTPTRPRLIASKVLDVLNSETISDCVDTSLQKIWGADLEKNKERVLLYVTNTASYMKASAELLKNTYKYVNLLHVTCLVQGLHHVAETVSECYPAVDVLIASVRRVFTKAPFRRRLFEEELPNTPLPPQPEEAHWSTWLEAASYYYVNFDDIKRIIYRLKGNDSLAVLEAQQAFEDPSLQKDLMYIHGNFSRIYLALRDLERITTSSEYSMTNAITVIFDLRNFIFRLSGNSANRVRKKFQTILQTNPGFSTLCGIVDLLAGKEVDFSQPNVNVPSLKNFSYFKYAPVTSIDVESSFSLSKWVLSDKITPERLEQYLLIYCNSTSD